MSQSLSLGLEASGSAHHGGVKMEDFLFIQGKPEHFVVVARYADLGRSPLDGDQLRTRGKLETVRQRRKSSCDLGVRLVARNPRLRSHCSLELIEMEIGLAKINGEIGRHG